MTESSDSQDQPGETPEAASGTSPADSDHSGGTASPEQATLGGISDDQLPEDLQPGEDNPLAEPLDPDDEATKDRDELEMDATQEDLGKPAVESARAEESQDSGESGESGGDANSGDGAEGAGITGG
jgi:hypothetical protein